MTSKRKYAINDKVLIRGFTKPVVKVILKKRYEPAKNMLGVSGWYAKIIYKKDVYKLIKSGVPYKKDEKPTVWVFDWQIIKKLPA
jgi:hypothetical protein